MPNMYCKIHYFIRRNYYDKKEQTSLRNKKRTRRLGIKFPSRRNFFPNHLVPTKSKGGKMMRTNGREITI